MLTQQDEYRRIQARTKRTSGEYLLCVIKGLYKFGVRDAQLFRYGVFDYFRAWDQSFLLFA